MRSLRVLFLSLFVITAMASMGHAALVFKLDFGQDGIFESSWPLKAGEVVSVDIYVSEVPEPGLGAMGMKVVYDAARLQVLQNGTGVDASNWPQPDPPHLDLTVSGQIDMFGFNMASALTGNLIKLGTIKLQGISEGRSEIQLLDRGQTVDCFVLADGTVADTQFSGGVFATATVRPPISGDVNGDEVVDLADGILALRCMVKLAEVGIHSNADVNGDNRIGLAEVIYIFQKTAGLR